MLYKIATALLLEGNLETTGNGSLNHSDGKNSWSFEKKSDMLYAIVRAVSVGTNGNSDFFSDGEIRKAYKTFIGKGLYVNHASNDVEKKRGVILDAQLCEERGELFVKCLLEINAKAFPELAQMIRSRHIDSVSMGAEVKFSECSVCGNMAKKTSEFCNCVKMFKGSVHNGKPVFEINHDIEFIELSLVAKPADSQAKILEIIARQQGKDFKELLQKAASLNFEVEPYDLIKPRNTIDDIVLAAIQRHRREKKGV